MYTTLHYSNSVGKKLDDVSEDSNNLNVDDNNNADNMSKSVSHVLHVNENSISSNSEDEVLDSTSDDLSDQEDFQNNDQ